MKESTSVYQAIVSRKSTRKFKDKPLPRDVLNAICQLGYRIPSAGNLRPIEIYGTEFPATESNGGFSTARNYIVICADFDKTTKKYGDRGITYVYMEAGHTAQNICLVAEAMGLGTCCVGAFDNDAIKKRYKLEHYPVYMVAVGYKDE